MTNIEKSLRDNIIKIAMSYLGTQEPNGDDQFIKWYNEQTHAGFSLSSTPWCCIFVSYCIYKAGVSTKQMPPFASCSYVINNVLKPNNQFKPKASGYTPIPGDLVFFDWSFSRSAEHVGLVQKVSNGKLYTIEGNTRGGYTSDGVRNKSYIISSDYIYGYGTPIYSGGNAATNSSSSSTIITPAIKCDSHISEFQEYLNKTYNSGLEVDGEYGPLTKSATVKAWQFRMNEAYKLKLAMDGSFSSECRRAARAISKGTTSALVYILQGLLFANGYDPIDLNGEFGPNTQAAVKAFQKDRNLKLTGTCNNETWCALFKK